MKKVFLSLLSIIFSLHISAQALLVENFTYNQGSALSANGWTAHSGAGTNPILVGEGLSFTGYTASGIGGAAYAVNNGEDVHRTFQEVTTGAVYVAFMVRTQPNNFSGYFLHLGQTTIGTTFFTRIWVNATGDGLGIGTAAPTTFVPISPNTSTLVVAKLDIASKVSSLYVFNSMPTQEPSQASATFTETANFTNIGSVALRQFNAEQKVVVDGIRIATNWADATGTSQNPNVPNLTVSPAALQGFQYVVGSGPSAAQTYTIIAENLTGSGNISVAAPANFEISLNGTTYLQNLSLPFSNGTIAGQPVTIHARLKAGLAIGTYTGQAITHNGGGATEKTVVLSGEVTSGLSPEISAEIVPQYIQGLTPTNTTRVPFAYLMTLANLLPNTTYRFINQVVSAADAPTVNGAGNPVFVSTTGNFYRSSSPSLSNEGGYGIFTTNSIGSYTGWFMIEPSGNARFAPGNEVFFRIRLNDGNNGTTAVTYLTSANFSKVINFGEEASNLQGTAFRTTSAQSAKNFVMMYDNVAGNGRPLYGTSIEAVGLDYNAATTWAEFYRNNVAGVAGAAGGILPNVNANGVQRIEERSIANGLAVQSLTSNNGVWGGTDTKNPTGGLTNVLVLNLNITNDPVLQVSPSILNGFTYVEGSGPSNILTYAITAEFLTGAGNISITAPANYEISLNGTSFASAQNLPFANGVITGQPITVHVRLKAGLAMGLYNDQLIQHSGGGAAPKTVTLNGEVTTSLVPSIVSEIVPLFIQGISPTNNTRLPYAFHVSMTGLQANSTYRYINQVVISTDGPTVSGAGNPIFVNSNATFTRSTSPSLATDNNYGTFTTDANGNYAGWFMTEATGNARFTPGNEVHFRIRINDGNNGTNPMFYLTTSNTAKVIDFGDNLLPNEGTGLRVTSNDPAKSFVLLYDNQAGNGRPIAATSVETTGIDYSTITSFAPFYRDHVSGVNGSWGTIIPNQNANGVKLIRVLNPFTAYTKDYTSPNGVWGLVDTRNPDGGLLNVLVIDLITIGLNESDKLPLTVTSQNRSINILLHTEGLLHFQLFNAHGQSILQERLNGSGNHQIPVILKPGVYVLHMMYNGKVKTQKLLIH